jgi:hypothetical protein
VFSAYLAVLRRERRRDGGAVLDVRPHMDTGFTDRVLSGVAPTLPDPWIMTRSPPKSSPRCDDGRRGPAWDLEARRLVAR